MECQMLLSAIDSLDAAFEHLTYRTDVIEAGMETIGLQLQHQASQFEALIHAIGKVQEPQYRDSWCDFAARIAQNVAHSLVDEIKVELQSSLEELHRIRVDLHETSPTQIKHTTEVDVTSWSTEDDSDLNNDDNIYGSSSDVDLSNGLEDVPGSFTARSIDEEVQSPTTAAVISPSLDGPHEEASGDSSNDGAQCGLRRFAIPRITCSSGSSETLCSPATSSSASTPSLQRTASLDAPDRAQPSLTGPNVGNISTNVGNITPRTRVRHAVSQWEKMHHYCTGWGNSVPVSPAVRAEVERVEKP